MAMMKLNGGLTFITILLAAPSSSFVSTVSVRSRLPSLLRFSNGDDTGDGRFSTAVLLPAAAVPEAKEVAPVGLREAEGLSIVLPLEADKPEDDSAATSTRQSLGQVILDFWRGIRHRLSVALKALQPSQKFQMGLLGVTMIATFMVRFLLPQVSILSMCKTWISTRGFHGLSALGRSITYGWGLFVAYPRMLDRRASERQKREKEHAIEIRRQHLTRLAGEISRLRQELATIDAEVRSFRREIIAMKVYHSAHDEGGMKNRDVEEAIGVEMKHLTQLRSDTQAALVGARHAWAELRSKSPPEAWDDDPLLI